MESHVHPKLEETEQKLSPNWLELPREVTVSILQKLNAVDIIEDIQGVCTQWESICKEPSLWRTIIFRNVFNPRFNLDMILFMEAVDRSCGGLIDLQLFDCYSVKFLKYATQRCTKIRCLRLVCGDISDGLCEVAKMLRMLEDLEISGCNMVISNGLRKLGECCPLLKSLKINRLFMPIFSIDHDSEAMSIAENMAELRHLQLLGNRLTNKGLKAILDNCTHLESLDLRQCSNLELDEDCSLGKRCTETFKDFRDPSDSFDYFDFDIIVYNNYNEAACYDSDYSFDSDEMRDMFQNIL